MSDDAKREWLIRALGFRFTEDGGALSRTDLMERLQILNEDARAHDARDALAEPLKAAAIAVKANADNAVELLEILEQRFAELARSKRMAEVNQTAKNATISAKAGLVGLAKMRLKLQAARSSYDMAVSNLETSRDALLNHPDFANDPRSKDPEFLKNAAAVAERVPDIEVVANEVKEVLDDMTNAVDLEARTALAQQAVASIGTYRAKLTDPILTVMENTPAGSFPILSVLSGALDDLANALRA